MTLQKEMYKKIFFLVLAQVYPQKAKWPLVIPVLKFTLFGPPRRQG